MHLMAFSKYLFERLAEYETEPPGLGAVLEPAREWQEYIGTLLCLLL